MEELLEGAHIVSLPGRQQDHALGEAQRLAAAIEQAVWRDTGGRVRNLHVQVNDDGVLLTGWCGTYYTKQRAQHAAMGVLCCGALTNQIEVG